MNKDSDIRLLKEEISRYPDDSIELVIRLLRFGEMLRLSGASFNEVIVNGVKALEISRKLEDIDSEALSLSILARHNLLFNKTKESLKFISESLNVGLRAKPLIRARIFCEYAFILQETGEFIESYECLENALNIGLQENDDLMLSRVYSYLSRLSYFSDDFANSIFFLNKALSFPNPQPSVTRNLDSLGYIYFLNQDYSKAIQALKTALEERNSFDLESFVNINNNLGLVYLKINKPEIAQQHIDISIKALAACDPAAVKLFTLSDFAEFYYESGNYEKSILYYEKHSKLATANKNKYLYFISEIQIGVCLLASGDHFQATQQLLLALSRIEQFGEKGIPNINNLLYRCHSALADLLHAKKQPAEAESHKQKAEKYLTMVSKAEHNKKTKMLTAKLKIEQLKAQI